MRKFRQMLDLTGSIVAVATPFNEDESVDFQSFENLVQFHALNGTNGIVVAGTTGEGYALETGEIVELVKRAKQIVAGKIPVIAGTGTLTTKKSIELSVAAEQAGADGLLLINPYYNKPTEEFLVQHFAAINQAVSIPIILYNVPGRTGFNMKPNFVLHLARTLNNVVAVKEASGNITQIAELIQGAPQGFKVFSGDDSLAYSTISLGGHGCISVVANIIPHAFSQLCNLALAGDLKSAQEIHHRYLDLFNANFIETNPVPVKTALAQYGFCKNVFRGPFFPWKNEEKKKEYFETLDKCGVEITEFILQEN